MKLSSILLSLCIKYSHALEFNHDKFVQIIPQYEVCNGSGKRINCNVMLDVPEACLNLDGSSDCPIVFFLHGTNGSNEMFPTFTQVHTNKVIGVYPQGEDGWNAGGEFLPNLNCEYFDFKCYEDPDDSLFISIIIQSLVKMGANGNVYAIGSSSGAALAYRLAANAGTELPIKGIVTKAMSLLQSPSRSGPGMLNYNQPPSFAGARQLSRKKNGIRMLQKKEETLPISVLNIMGENDGLIPYDGGDSDIFKGHTDFSLMSARVSMTTWSQYNKCHYKHPEVSEVNYSTVTTTGTALHYVFGNCTEGAIVEHYQLKGVEHSAGQGYIEDTKIDYDLIYDFIFRVEAVLRFSNYCVNDPDWHVEDEESFTCEYISNNRSRCGWVNDNGVDGDSACKLACMRECW
eukprot:CAMPEP_0197825682 /NCGR_PEP_ID=MMETSP1437-20131217/2725_1 /TAXON_ID=49252 ORGANISM="Eucampia antarctica, Strain CCMP1452" /NCGR_SAMPLE_ID=MMETSP1437 /ASSEMBLY_ACC=CAM_ASM_001096 /LENGTH=401 /DNA_ID=CAMNT_0043425789 /DNA_START=88 /DNA_END=1290 /DNA_ORIENTATION=-